MASTNTAQYDTNLYRAGDLNLPVRMMNILNTSSQPDFVEIITWVGALVWLPPMTRTDTD